MSGVATRYMPGTGQPKVPTHNALEFCRGYYKTPAPYHSDTRCLGWQPDRCLETWQPKVSTHTALEFCQDYYKAPALP
jgi:hypothetical protein